MEGIGRGRALTTPAWMGSTGTAGGLSNGSKSAAAKEWAEHTHTDGRKYYHHKVTGKTTWEKPNELKSAEELAAGAGPWKEFTSDTGRKYYHNTLTGETSWEIPTKTSDVTSPKAGGPTSPQEKKDPISAFKDLLTSSGVKPNWSWEMAQGQISTDPRFKVLKSMAEKKQAFNDWCQQKKKYDEDDKKRKDRQVEEDFFNLLRDCKDINPKVIWKKAIPFIETDPRYSAVDERDRELFYERFLYDVESKERKDASQVRMDAMLRFKKFLEATPSVTVKTQWRKLKDQLVNEPVFRALDKLDSLTVFEDHMVDLDKKLEDDARMEREKQKRESRKARDAFRDLLAEKLDLGELTLKTKWKDFVKAVKDKEDERYLNMYNTTGYGETVDSSSTPYELFCDFLDDLEERLDKDKRILRDILKDTNFAVSLTSTFEEFQAALSPHERFTIIPHQNLKHLFYELKDKAESKEHSNQKRKKKLVSAFKDYMKTVKEITPTSTWIEARPLLLASKEFEAVDDEQEREKAFNEYIVRLNSKEEDVPKEEGESEGEEGEEKQHKKKEHKSKSKKHRHGKERKKKRHSHSSSEDDLPAKKQKQADRKDDDMSMEEGEEGERRDKKEENGDDRKSRREEGEVKPDEEDRYHDHDRHSRRRNDRRRDDRREEDRGRGRDERGLVEDRKPVVEEKEEGETE